MACEACEHCQGPLSADEAVMRDGYSYHKECHKCYVCSDTNLDNAEVFRGVIFCSSCSQRIFQGCSTARQTKNTARPRWGRSKSRTRRRERVRQPAARARPRLQRESGVIELARMGRSTDTESSSDHYIHPTIVSKPPEVPAKMPSTGRKRSSGNVSSELKKESLEMGVTTEFTLELLKEMNCPIVEWKMTVPSAGSKDPKAVRPFKKPSTKIEEKRKPIWSDIRIAELGASTEIAHMALRKRSVSREKELPITIKSSAVMKVRESMSLSVLSDKSDDGLEEWLDTTYRALKRSGHLRLLDRPVRSIVKMPFIYFKTRIINRSSLVSVLVSSGEDYRSTILDKFKMLFREEITCHHRRGMKKLYSTINKRACPYKLGWLHCNGCTVQTKRISQHSSDNCSSRRPRSSKCYQCRHFRRSHSYRCLRSHVMKLAGPTKSQLGLLRRKLLKVFAWPILVKKYVTSPEYPAISMSETCDNSEMHEKESTKS